MKISVLIDNFNYGVFLRQTIDSVLIQTYPDIEVVVVDDGSTDDSAEILRSYGDQIKPVFQENSGQGVAFYQGFIHSTGDIIMLLDADDYLHPEAAAKIAAAWKPETGALFHRLCAVDKDGRKLGYSLPDQRLELSTGNLVPYMLTHAGRCNVPSTSGMAFRRDILGQVLPMPPEFNRRGPDGYLRVSVPLLATVAALDETLAYYRIHGANDHAGGTARRFITRKIMERRKELREREYRQFRKLVEERGLEIAQSASPCNADDHFEELLLDRSGAQRMDTTAYWKLVWTILGQMREEKMPLKRRLRQGALAFLVAFGPKAILRRVYPNLFG